jgi:oxygen-independent coproporphyrinogen-3 oxidase
MAMKTSLYVHIPFCIRKCPYCDFNSLAGSEIPLSDYTHAVIAEMEIRRSLLPIDLSASTLYLGGGTPSLLEPDQIAAIVESAKRNYALSPDAEITLEANPGTVDGERLGSFRSKGVNRLSLGIQSFSDGMLTRLGRVHTAGEGVEAFNAAREAGFDNIGIDLIHSLPGQTPSMWLKELERAVSLRPEHISAYGLTVEPGTPFHSMEKEGLLLLPDDESAAEMFEMTSTYLRNAGYEHYEISNFALPGLRSRHNQVYWERGNYIGFGAGAHSFLSRPPYGRRWRNPDPPEIYIQTVSAGVVPELEKVSLTERQAMAEMLFLGLRMIEGVDVEKFRTEFGIPIEDAYGEQLPQLLDKGLLEWNYPLLRLSSKGLSISNQVVMLFL